MFKDDVKKTQKLDVVDTIRGYNPISSNKGTITNPPPIPSRPANSPVITA
jgi:hypothetical protein